jgi:hypothetical protein
VTHDELLSRRSRPITAARPQADRLPDGRAQQPGGPAVEVGVAATGILGQGPKQAGQAGRRASTTCLVPPTVVAEKRVTALLPDCGSVNGGTI